MVVEESRGIPSESVFHTVCYHNGERVQEQLELSSMTPIPRLSSIKISGDF